MSDGIPAGWGLWPVGRLTATDRGSRFTADDRQLPWARTSRSVRPQQPASRSARYGEQSGPCAALYSSEDVRTPRRSAQKTRAKSAAYGSEDARELRGVRLRRRARSRRRTAIHIVPRCLGASRRSPVSAGGQSAAPTRYERLGGGPGQRRPWPWPCRSGAGTGRGLPVRERCLLGCQGVYWPARGVCWDARGVFRFASGVYWPARGVCWDARVPVGP